MNRSVKINRKADRRTELLEWAIAVISGVSVAALFGYLLLSAIMSSDKPTFFDTHVATIRQSDGFNYVTVSVTNMGSHAAADITVTGSVERDGKEERASANLDYAPAESRSEVTLVFSGEVVQEALDLRVEGYRDP
ncbi:MAG: hypothetical protein KME20_27670 [Kaiparowitsia implicata GSE-PSE-MK54-09C]|jgi:uncharacterized protein (TIGR02588 family)|nr:hypothetical protein [Kaiparowitsia implicata GSE-PSE-MK54-09C]